MPSGFKLLLSFVVLLWLTACSIPKNTPVIGQSLTAGVVHQATLVGVTPIYISRFARSIYTNVGGSIGQIAGEDRVGLTDDFSRIRLGENLGEAMAGLLETRNNLSECQFYLETDDEILLRSINSNLFLDSNRSSAEDAKLEQEIQKTRRELDDLKRDILELRQFIVQTGELDNLDRYISELENLYSGKLGVIDTLEARVQAERETRKPGLKIVSVVNPCRDFSIGDRIGVIVYGRDFVIDRLVF